MTWLTVIGLGEDGYDALPARQRAIIEDASLLVGGERHLAMLPESAHGRRLVWRRPLLDTVGDIEAARGQRVVVLATGHPMSYGIGGTLARHFRPDEMQIIPAVGAFDLACARLGWHREDVARVTLHGRPLDLLRPHIVPHRRILVLSEDGATPRRVAALLAELGYGKSRVRVLEHLGGPDERQYETTAAEWGDTATTDLNTIAVECVAGADAEVLSTAPGLPDEVFANDGQLTKRVVRAASVTALAPRPGACLWDLGAGCGSVAIEWLRASPGGTAYAVERVPERCALIRRNANVLGVPQLNVIESDVAMLVGDLPKPDAVFIGGGLSTDAVDSSHNALSAHGRLVANAVTLEGEVILAYAHGTHGGDLTRISVAHTAKVGERTGWRPAMPVTQWSLYKS